MIKLCQSIAATILCMLIITNSLAAQEICNDGIDNDTNGYIDCYDITCINSEFCNVTNVAPIIETIECVDALFPINEFNAQTA